MSKKYLKKFIIGKSTLKDLGIGAAAGVTQAAVTLPFDKYEQLVTNYLSEHPSGNVPVKKLLRQSFKDTFGKHFKEEYTEKYPARAAKSAVGGAVTWGVTSKLLKTFAKK